MKKRFLILFLTLCLLMPLLPVSVQAAAAPRVKVVNYSTDDWTWGEWVEYEFNGTRFRSDKMGAAFNLRAFNLMSSTDKRLCVNVCGYRNRQDQFGVDGATEMCNWLDDYLGWTDARKVLQDRIAAREFGPINAYFENETVSPFDAEFSALLEKNKGLPEVQTLLALRKQLDATYLTGKEVAATLSDTTMDKVRAGVKILGKETISLITDRVLVPAITPAGMAGLGADVAGEVIAFVDKATGMTDALYENVELGVGNDPKALMKDLNAVISENATAADQLMEQSQLLQADLEEAVYAAEEAIAAGDKKSAPTINLMGNADGSENTLQWYGTRSGKLQQKLDELAQAYMETFADWKKLLDGGLPEVVEKQAIIQRENSTDVVYYEVPSSLNLIRWNDYRNAYTNGDTTMLNAYKACNPVIADCFSAILRGNATLDGFVRQWGTEIEPVAEREQKLRGKLSYLSEEMAYYRSMLNDILSGGMGSALQPYAKAAYASFTKFNADQFALVDPKAHGFNIPNLTGSADADCGYITGFKYAALAANLHFMDRDFNQRSDFAADFEIVKDEIISLYHSAKNGRTFTAEELSRIQNDYIMWMNAFDGGLDGAFITNYCPKGTVYASEYLTHLCSERNFYYYINSRIYSGERLHRRMCSLFNLYFGSLGGKDGLIWEAAGLSAAPVELLPVGSAAARLPVGGTADLAVRFSPAAHQAAIRWSVADSTVAVVEQNGLTAVVKGLKPGSTTVTARAEDAAAVYDEKAGQTVYCPAPVTFAVTVLEQAESRFDDVPENAYFCKAVDWAVGKKITNGTGEGRFSPGLNCTRGQIVTFLWRAMGSPEPETAVSPFTDVSSPSAYYYKAVLWAIEKGVTNGTGESRFSPDAIVSRAQSVTFLWRAAGKPEPKTAVSLFTDVSSPAAYYYKAVLWAVENEITNGTGNNCFSPDASCTRGQIVTLLYRQMAA